METNTSNNGNNPYLAPGADMTAVAETNAPALAGLERRLGAAIVDGLISATLVLLPMVLYFG
ncbi:MAG: hypothetical protein K2X63_02505 [Burkholderiaceae bacterium]|nr:hypothetical protein [Burkholderiaceae bacterium]